MWPLQMPVMRWLVLLTLSIWAVCGYAAGLGSMRMLSGLGQPLHASIVLTGEDTKDLATSCIKSKLQSTDGVFIAIPRVSIRRNDDSNVIHLTTNRGIREPAVTLLIAVNCGMAVNREYQLLLDPVVSLPLVEEVREPSAQTAKVAIARKPQSVALTTPNTSSSRLSSKRSQSQEKPEVSESKKSARSTKAARHEARQEAKKTVKSVLRLSGDDTALIEEPSAPAKLKITDHLSESTTIVHTQQSDELRAAQARFAAILRGDDPAKVAEDKLKAAEAQMKILQAEADRVKQQNQAEKKVQEEIRKELFPFSWVLGLGALLLASIGAIGWLVWRLLHTKKASAQSWQNTDSDDSELGDLETIQTISEYDFLSTIADETQTATYASIDSEEIAEKKSEDKLEKTFTETDSQILAVDNLAEGGSAASAVGAKHVQQPVASPAAASLSKSTTVQAADDDMRNELPSLEDSNTLPLNDPGAIKRLGKDIKKTLKVEEISDVMQEAEFWMLLHDPFRAIEILEPYRDVDQPESPVPWIYLLDLYRVVGEQEKYESMLARVEDVFNAKIPRWDGEIGATTKSLEDFPHIVETICDLWDGEQIVQYLESLLFDDRDGARDGFDLPVYRDIVQLITLAREPERSKRHEQLKFGKAQAILFSSKAPKSINTESVDLDVGSADSTLGQTSALAAATEAAAKEAAAVRVQAAALATLRQQAMSRPSAIKPNAVVKSETGSAAAQSAATPLAAKINPLVEIDEPEINASSMRPGAVAAVDLSSYHDDNTTEMGTKLNLAIAYQEIGEKDGARVLLYEVIKGGTPEQSEKAKAMLAKLS